MFAATAAQASHLHALSQLVNATEAAHPNALWRIVHSLCVRDMRASGDPAPCAKVDLAGGYALVKDVERRSQYLLTPTERVTGIESPALMAPRSPNYFQAAWASRQWVEKAVGHPLPREAIGLAVNSFGGRTQNQLHIHIDCVRPEVLQALHAHQAEIGAHWSRLNVGLAGRRYRARWISGADLGATDPFKLLYRTDALARADMGRESLGLIAATRPDGAPGFILLSDRSDPARDHDATVEEVLDHRCRVAAEPGERSQP